MRKQIAKRVEDQKYDEALHWYDRARYIDQTPSSYTLGHIAVLLWFQGKVSEARKYLIRQAPQPMPGLDEIIKLIEHATAPM